MPHVAGHRMGGNYIPPKKNEPKPPKQTNPYVNQSTGKSYVPKGFTGIGGSSVSDRLKQSKKDYSTWEKNKPKEKTTVQQLLVVLETI